MRKLLWLFVAVIMISGCTTVPQNSSNPIKNSATVSQSFDNVWGAAIATVSEKGFPIITSDKNSGLISTQSVPLQGGFNIPSRIQRVAFFPYHVVPFSDARYSLNIVILKQLDGTTKIVITPTIEGYNNENWIVFQSNGTLEANIIQEVKNKL